MAYSDRIKDLRTETQTLQNQAKTLHADLEVRVKGLEKTEGEARATAERDIAADQTKLDNMLTDGRTKRAELERLITLEDNENFLNREEAAPRVKNNGHSYAPERKTWGQIVVSSPEFKTAPATSSNPRMDRVNVKAVYSSVDGAGGILIQTQRIADVITSPQRPASVLALINNSETTSDAVEYAEQTSRTNNAAPVAEFTGGNFGLKPESTMAFELKTAAVKTIAHWVAVSRNILRDAPRLRDTIDIDLTEGLRVVLENEIVSGSGSGEHFRGITNATGILTRTQGTGSPRGLSGDTVADTLRRAITDVVLQFYTPNGIILNPTDAEAIELDKGDDLHYTKIMDPATGRLWRLAVAETAALTAKTALVGDLMMAATIWDRMQTEIRVGEPNDMFLRNALAVLAELRAAFAVVRPAAVSKVTLT